MPFANRVDRRIWWLTLSKAADRSSNRSIEDLESALASLRASTTESKTVSVECPLLKPDWLLSRRLFYVRKAVTWLNTARSRVFGMTRWRETGLWFSKIDGLMLDFLSSGVMRACLNAEGKTPVWRDVLMMSMSEKNVLKSIWELDHGDISREKREEWLIYT